MFDENLSLQDSINKVINWISDYRTAHTSDFFTYQSHKWDCDSRSVTNISGAVTIALMNGGNLPGGFQWRDYDNNMVDVTGAYMCGMAASYMTFVTASYIASWQHKGTVAALTDIAGVQEYEYTSSLWPDPNTQY
jgi:hypothetical protein